MPPPSPSFSLFSLQQPGYTGFYRSGQMLLLPAQNLAAHCREKAKVLAGARKALQDFPPELRTQNLSDCQWLPPSPPPGSPPSSLTSSRAVLKDYLCFKCYPDAHLKL